MATHFEPELFRFLRDLESHNDRDWFARNRERYEKDVRQPFLAFIADFADPLSRVSRYVVADPRPVGGSVTGSTWPERPRSPAGRPRSSRWKGPTALCRPAHDVLAAAPMLDFSS